MKEKRKRGDVRGLRCPCGKPAVAEVWVNDFWCQDCLDKQPIVRELHERAYVQQTRPNNDECEHAEK